MSQELVEDAKHIALRVAAANPQLRVPMESMVAIVAELERERVRLAARVLELEGPVVVEPPPVVVDPPVVPAEPVKPWKEGYRPELDDLRAATVLRPWRSIVVAPEASLDWIVTPGRAESLRGLGVLYGDTDNSDRSVIGHAYRESRKAGHGEIVRFGVRGFVGAAALGGFYGSQSGQDVCWRQSDGQWAPLQVEFVGLDAAAEVQLTWGGFQGGAEHGRTGWLQVSTCGIRLGQGVHGITANTRGGDVVLDRCWLLQHPLMQGRYNAGLHTANLDSLVIAGLERRARPDGSGVPLYQRHVLYHKNHRDALWVVGSDLVGGNQTGVQIRPGKGEAPAMFASQGPVALIGNRAHRYGHEHDGPSGGSLLSVWSSPHAPVVIARNRITQARYGAIMCQAQGGGLDWLNDDGLPLGDVLLSQNELEGVGDRPSVMLNAARRVVVDHACPGGLVLDNAWGQAQHGLRVKRAVLVGAGQAEDVEGGTPDVLEFAQSWEDVL